MDLSHTIKSLERAVGKLTIKETDHTVTIWFKEMIPRESVVIIKKMLRQHFKGASLRWTAKSRRLLITRRE